MTSIYRTALLVFCFTAPLCSVAQAALLDRGGGLIYDDVLNVTWLQDASYAKTIDPDGNYSHFGAFFNWQDARNWASNLVYHDAVRNVDFSDWRLPTVLPTSVAYGENNYWQSLNASPQNEMAYMYFVNLGLKNGDADAPNGSYSPTGYGIFRDGTTGGQTDITVGSVTIKNLQSATYWSGTNWDVLPDQDFHFLFTTAKGSTIVHDDSFFRSYAWAVRDGDVSPIPEPETYTMMLAGLGLLGFAARRRSVC